MTVQEHEREASTEQDFRLGIQDNVKTMLDQSLLEDLQL